jgi:hypothetical protein
LERAPEGHEPVRVQQPGRVLVPRFGSGQEPRPGAVAEPAQVSGGEPEPQPRQGAGRVLAKGQAREPGPQWTWAIAAAPVYRPNLGSAWWFRRWCRWVAAQWLR